MAPKRTPPKTHNRARQLRHQQTEFEGRLWYALRAHQVNDVHFRRQHPIDKYIVDFCAPRQKLVIEIDGGQHLEQVAYDERRTRYLESKGYQVLRFWNHDIATNLDDVMNEIMEILEKDERKICPPPPSPKIHPANCQLSSYP